MTTASWGMVSAPASSSASAATVASAGADATAARPLGTVTVKGRAEPVAIFALDSPGAGNAPAGTSETPFPCP